MPCLAANNLPVLDANSNMSIIVMLVCVSFMYMCTQCMRSNTRAQALRGSIVASPHASSVLQNAHPRSDAALQMARPHHLCCPPGHGASAAASSQNMASPHRCTIVPGIKRMSLSFFMLLAATSFPLSPRAFYILYSLLEEWRNAPRPPRRPALHSFLPCAPSCPTSFSPDRS